MLLILICIISREFSAEGPGLVSISPDNKRTQNIKICAQKLKVIDQFERNLNNCLVLNNNDWTAYSK